MADQIKFQYVEKQADYDAASFTKATGTLYFIRDTGRIYRGTVPFAKPIVFVDSWPSNVATDLDQRKEVPYFNTTTKELKIWSNNSWITIVPELITSDESAVRSDSAILSAAAVMTYVDDAVSGTGGSPLDPVDSIAALRDLTNLGNGDTCVIINMGRSYRYYSEESRTNHADDGYKWIHPNTVTEDDATRGLWALASESTTYSDGNGISFNENVISIDHSNEFDSSNGTLAINTISDSKITLSSGGTLSGNFGSKMDKVTTATSGNVATFGTGGSLSDSTYKIGGDTITGSANTLATEAAVKTLTDNLTLTWEE